MATTAAPPSPAAASAIRKFAEQERTEFAIKAPNVQERCSALSGGNQQKVVIARVFSENPDVIIVAQPTRGVDVGAMEYIHHRLLDLRDGGKSILLISADLDEVRSLSDRLAVIYGGRIVAEGKPDTWSDMEIGLLMTGGTDFHGMYTDTPRPVGSFLTPAGQLKKMKAWKAARRGS